MTLLYEGSVKNIRGPVWVGDVPAVVFEYSDAFSVFDWGRMPDAIPGKGQALGALMAGLYESLGQASHWSELSAHPLTRAFRANASKPGLLNEIGERLQRQGLPTHYLGVFDGVKAHPLARARELGISTHRILVREVSVKGRGTVPGLANPRLVPLEVVFRFEAPMGSSLREREPELFLKTPNPRWDYPKIEFFTKLEPQDRHLSFSEACALSELSAQALENLAAQTAWVAQALRVRALESGLSLLDGKLEWGQTPEGEFFLVDSIGPDELRLTPSDSPGVSLSKEFLRQYYRSTPWFKALSTRKKNSGVNDPWKSEWLKEAPPWVTTPPSLPVAWVRAAKELYQGVCELLLEAPRDGLDPLFPLLKTLQNLSRGHRVWVVGSGGREHALSHALLRAPEVSHLSIVPGNDAVIESLKVAFSSPEKTIKRVTGSSEVSTKDFIEQAVSRAHDEGVDLIVVGPDQALQDGWVNAAIKAGVRAFGPTREAARIEWSKAFSKSILSAAKIPTAHYALAQDREMAREKLGALPESWKGVVIKKDGLALGKGVFVCASVEEAQAVLAREESLATGELVLEERLIGEEVSFFALCAGTDVRMLTAARDYKRLDDADQGPNTGGMGAYSPVEPFDERWSTRIRNEVFIPVLQELSRQGTPFSGVLYAGLMVDQEQYRVLEFNARFGDPEAQVILPRWDDDDVSIYQWFQASAQGSFERMPEQVPFRPNAAVLVVGASPGYPSAPERGLPVSTGDLNQKESSHSKDWPPFFWAGVTRTKSGGYETAGGRVVGALGLAPKLSEAREKAYARAAVWGGLHYRTDIAGEGQK